MCVDRLRDSSDAEEADDVPYLNETELQKLLPVNERAEMND